MSTKAELEVQVEDLEQQVIDLEDDVASMTKKRKRKVLTPEEKAEQSLMETLKEKGML